MNQTSVERKKETPIIKAKRINIDPLVFPVGITAIVFLAVSYGLGIRGEAVGTMVMGTAGGTMAVDVIKRIVGT